MNATDNKINELLSKEDVKTRSITHSLSCYKEGYISHPEFLDLLILRIKEAIEYGMSLSKEKVKEEERLEKCKHSYTLAVVDGIYKNVCTKCGIIKKGHKIQ
jgi:hypothetical protein